MSHGQGRAFLPCLSHSKNSSRVTSRCVSVRLTAAGQNSLPGWQSTATPLPWRLRTNNLGEPEPRSDPGWLKKVSRLTTSLYLRGGSFGVGKLDGYEADFALNGWVAAQILKKFWIRRDQRNEFVQRLPSRASLRSGPRIGRRRDPAFIDLVENHSDCHAPVVPLSRHVFTYLIPTYPTHAIDVSCPSSGAFLTSCAAWIPL
jgi:hypothetical protein